MDIQYKLRGIQQSLMRDEFSISVEDEKKFIQKLPNPQDDIERSYFQYLCQKKKYWIWVPYVANIVCFIIYIPLFILLLFKSKPIESTSRNAVFLRDDKPKNILPKVLVVELADIESNPTEGALLKKSDVCFMNKLILKYPLLWWCHLKILLKISRYRWIIEMYDPKNIIVCNEYSFTSSILTSYCEENNIVHINVMHGEKWYSITDAFFRYDRCYVWDEYYKELFLRLRADKNQFVIAIPPSLSFSNQTVEKMIDYTYYLGGEDDIKLERIYHVMKWLKNKGMIVALRPHPRYSNIKTITKKFSDLLIEDNNLVSIENSILRTRNVVSCFSTVLNQAYYNGVNVVLDDITEPSINEQLKRREYIMLHKKHMLLSQLVYGNSDMLNDNKI